MNLTENYKAPSIIIFSHKGFKEIDLTKSIEEVDKVLCEILRDYNLL